MLSSKGGPYRGRGEDDTGQDEQTNVEEPVEHFPHNSLVIDILPDDI